MSNEMERQITSNTYLKGGQVVSLYQTTDDSVSMFIDIIRYGFLRSSTQQIEPEFRKKFYELDINEQLRLSPLDKTHTLTAMTIENIMFNGIPPNYTIHTNNIKLANNILSAINISNNFLDGIPSDHELLYKYFVNASINQDQAQRFLDASFQKLLTSRLLTEQRVLFTSIANNLIVMIEVGALSPEIHQQFFKDLFNRETYVQGEQKILFRLAISKSTKLLDSILSIRLLIDPFSKQTNYSTWLNHVQKYLFIVGVAADLAKQNPEVSPTVKNSLRDFSYFSAMYKRDKFIGDR